MNTTYELYILTVFTDNILRRDGHRKPRLSKGGFSLMVKIGEYVNIAKAMRTFRRG